MQMYFSDSMVTHFKLMLAGLMDKAVSYMSEKLATLTLATSLSIMGALFIIDYL